MASVFAPRAPRPTPRNVVVHGLPRTPTSSSPHSQALARRHVTYDMPPCPTCTPTRAHCHVTSRAPPLAALNGCALSSFPALPRHTSLTGKPPPQHAHALRSTQPPQGSAVHFTRAHAASPPRHRTRPPPPPRSRAHAARPTHTRVCHITHMPRSALNARAHTATSPTASPNRTHDVCHVTQGHHHTVSPHAVPAYRY
ncbi:hypothetical protein FA95DRAFT_1610682 [Auriscalpium vulgare]|uniref:Uncharacterized protein n=1 Tax=Auriscalpium vulgare TaxID=40419 RepID=A0ACB8RDY1_9AGAM|nr:hypothetical protein FA95DRAFT_1610682 [Auriscalpium vulgare]